ncbi:hypothetical protein WKI68_24315 [Streptomyces sp. MS1.HAVA.3]|uniref:Uncharacterized protein n=1 Tax=Streptomyces caledonius TaxID=3134107 RepID=A0ABU8U705_9ACTN
MDSRGPRGGHPAGWSAETGEPADISKVPWTPENPAWGRCDITALVVQDLVGGELVLGEVFHDGRPEGYHWWNLLPGGIRVDLTREQFRRGETVTPGRVVERPGGRLRRRWEEYQLLRQRVIEKLGPLPGRMVTPDGRRLAYTDFGGPGRRSSRCTGTSRPGRLSRGWPGRWVRRGG